jgi:hypothetical protein
VPRPVAIWNSARDVWETPATEGFFCEHLDVYSATFPTSGMTRNGEAYAQQTWVPRMVDSAFSFSHTDVLPTPAARDWRSAGLKESHEARTQAQPLSEIIHMLPPQERQAEQLLPTVVCPAPHDSQETAGKIKAPRPSYGPELTTIFDPDSGAILPTPRCGEGMKNDLRPHAKDTSRLEDAVAVNLLPTPVVTDAEGTRNATANRRPGAKFKTGTTLTDALLPSPRASDGEKGGPNQRGSKGDMMLPSAVVQLLPTPAANIGDNGGSQHPEKRRAGNHQPSIQDVAEHLLLPTPVAQPSGNSPEDHLRKKPGRAVVTDLAIIAEHNLLESGGRLLPTPAAMDGSGGRVSKEKGGFKENGVKRSITLATAIAHDIPTEEEEAKKLLPTPTVGMMLGGSKTRSGSRSEEKLLPGVAEEIATTSPGDPTNPQSADGNTSSGVQLPGQLSLADVMDPNA